MLTREDFFVDGEVDPEILEWVKEEFVGLTEIMELLTEHPNFANARVTKQSVFHLATKANFPSPIPLHLAMGRVWLASKIKEWADGYEPPFVPPKFSAGKTPNHSKEDIQRWRDLFEKEGKNFTQIAREYGVHQTTVSRALRKEIL